MADNDRNIPSRGGVWQRGMVGRSPRSRAAARPQHSYPRASVDGGRSFAPDNESRDQNVRQHKMDQGGYISPGDISTGGAWEQNDSPDSRNSMDYFTGETDNYNEDIDNEYAGDANIRNAGVSVNRDDSRGVLDDFSADRYNYNEGDNNFDDQPDDHEERNYDSGRRSGDNDAERRSGGDIERRRGDAERRRSNNAERNSGDANRRSGEIERRRGDAERRGNVAERRDSPVERRDSFIDQHDDFYTSRGGFDDDMIDGQNNMEDNSNNYRNRISYDMASNNNNSNSGRRDNGTRRDTGPERDDAVRRPQSGEPYRGQNGGQRQGGPGNGGRQNGNSRDTGRQNGGSRTAAGRNGYPEARSAAYNGAPRRNAPPNGARRPPQGESPARQSAARNPSQPSQRDYPPRQGASAGPSNRGGAPNGAPRRPQGGAPAYREPPRGASRAAAPGGAARRNTRGKIEKPRVTQIVNIVLIAVSLVVIAAIVLMYNNSTYNNNNIAQAPPEELTHDNVYEGVFVSGADVSGMSYEELIIYLNNEFGGSLNSKYITVKIGELTEKYSFTELGVRYNIEEAAKQAYDIGRTGADAERLRKIAEVASNPVNLHLVYTYDQDKVDELANRIAGQAGVLTEDAEVRYTPTSVVIKPGREGIRIDKDDLTDRLREALDNFESAEIDVKLITSPPDKIDADKIFDTIYIEPADAYYQVSDNHKSISIVAEVPGQSVDQDKLISAINSLNSNSSAEVTIPLIAIDAKVKKADLDVSMFNDKLGSASTNFSVGSTNNRNRRDNMTLATKTITGYILAPGDEFAFNDAVGKRTEANGYKMAGAFMNGQLIDDVGGGICQVSSTLYNAVLYADLAVTVRQNHSYIVGYVKQGFDATVSYPQPDFKFKNTSAHPVRIDCGVDGTTISFSIYGTLVGQKKTITFSSEVMSTTNFNRITSEDPNLPVGTTNVSQAGRVGYTIDTYKTVQVGDGPKETIKVATNKYKTMDQIETIGTKPLPPDEEPSEPIVIGPAEGEEDYISDGNAAQSSGSAEQNTSGGEVDSSASAPTAENGRPIRTPRPSREITTTKPSAPAEKTTDATQDGADTTTAAAEVTTAPPAAETTAAVETTQPAAETTAAIETTAPSADSGGGGGGDGNDDGGAAAPKRTPRPRQ